MLAEPLRRCPALRITLVYTALLQEHFQHSILLLRNTEMVRWCDLLQLWEARYSLPDLFQVLRELLEQLHGGRESRGRELAEMPQLL